MQIKFSGKKSYASPQVRMREIDDISVRFTFPSHSYTDVMPGIIFTQAASLPLQNRIRIIMLQLNNNICITYIEQMSIFVR